jgi:hypothetical protein
MKFINDNPVPPKEVTVTFSFDEFMAVMHLIWNSNRPQFVDDLELITDEQYTALITMWNTFFESDYYKFFRDKYD